MSIESGVGMGWAEGKDMRDGGSVFEQIAAQYEEGDKQIYLQAEVESNAIQSGNSRQRYRRARKKAHKLHSRQQGIGY